MKLEYDQVSKEPKEKKINNYWNINVITLHVKCRIRNGDLWKGRREGDCKQFMISMIV